jgi:hypothetical protein
VKQGIAVLGMKPMGDGLVLKSGTVTAVECLHYALNLPTSVVITGCETPDRIDQAIEAVRTFRPLSRAQIDDLLRKTRDAVMTGQYELFKTSTEFDSTAHNPHWMGAVPTMSCPHAWSVADDELTGSIGQEHVGRQPR